jgi:hypothetical protein
MSSIVNSESLRVAVAPIWRELGSPAPLAVDSDSLLPRAADPRVTILVIPDILIQG